MGVWVCVRGSICTFIDRSVGRSVDRSVRQLVVGYAVNRPISPFVRPSVGRLVGRPAGRSVSQSVGRRSVVPAMYVERGSFCALAPYLRLTISPNYVLQAHRFVCFLGQFLSAVKPLEDNNSRVFAWRVLRLFVCPLCLFRSLLKRSTRPWRKSL